LIQVVWEFVVREKAEQRFMLVFGPGGAWSRAFCDAPGYRGTTLLCDISDSRRFLVFDLWDSAPAREEYLGKHPDGASQLDVALAELVERKTELGVFHMRADATVRARPKRRV
jgi:heme-degrading monooxygenase HmoA